MAVSSQEVAEQLDVQRIVLDDQDLRQFAYPICLKLM
jgi:hypothetical protein